MVLKIIEIIAIILALFTTQWVVWKLRIIRSSVIAMFTTLVGGFEMNGAVTTGVPEVHHPWVALKSVWGWRENFTSFTTLRVVLKFEKQ